MRERPLTARGNARLDTLVRTAAELFLERGYEAVSLDDLIARAGGSRRNIYDHLGGKEGLFIEATTQLCRELSEPLEALDIRGNDIRAALALFGRQLLDAVLQPRAIGLHRLMIAEGQRFPHLAQAVWQAGHGNAARILSEPIEAWQTEARISRDVPAAVLAEQFINLVVAGPQLSVLIGLQTLPLTPDAIVRQVEQAVIIFTKGIVPEKGHPHA